FFRFARRTVPRLTRGTVPSSAIGRTRWSDFEMAQRPGIPEGAPYDLPPEGGSYELSNYLTTNLLIRQHPVQLRRVLIRNLFHPAHLPLRLRGLARQDVALEGRATDDLARAGFLEPLG